jgi:hypothetical protein
MNRGILFFFGIIFCTFTFLGLYPCDINYGFAENISWTEIDENLEIYILVGGVNIVDADTQSDAILLEQDGDIISHIEIRSISDKPIELKDMDIVLVLADVDTLKTTKEMNKVIHLGETYSTNDTLNLEKYLGSLDVIPISGIYKFRYEIEYTRNNQTINFDGDPFYMKIAGNPLTTVTGAAATIITTASVISLAQSIISIIRIGPDEILNSINSSIAAPTRKLLSFYRGKTYKTLQNEISNSVYEKTRTWKRDICPMCNVQWPETSENCIECQLTTEKARDIYYSTLEDKCIQTGKELVDSVSGLSLYSITEKIGTGIIPTTSIISVLSYSGLSLFKPRISPHLSEKTRKLLFKSLSTALLIIFWIQAVNISVVSITTLIIALITGSIPALIIRRFLDLNIKNKVINTISL